MKSVSTIIRESAVISLMAGLLMAGWQTGLAAYSMRSFAASPISWIHFALYTLGGFIILSLVMLMPAVIAAMLYGLRAKAWETGAIRRFLLTGLIGTLLIAYTLTFAYWLDKPIVTEGNLSLRNSLTVVVIMVLSYILSWVISLGLHQLWESRTDRTRWNLLWGWWIFMAVLPPIGLAIIKLFSRTSYLFVIAIIAIIGLALLLLLYRAGPKFHDWLIQGKSKRPLWAVVLIFVVYAVTWPFPEAIRRGEPSSPDHPPVVLITIDTLRPDALTCYPEGTCLRLGSPNIDKLASEGVLFEQAYAAASWTRPSVPSFLSGLPPSAHGAFVDDTSKLADGATTLAEILQDNGYATGGFVVNLILRAGSGNEQGFDVYVEERTLQNWGRKLLFQTLIDRVRLHWPEPMTPNDNPLMERNAVRRANNFIREHSGERFFLWLHLLAPHENFYPPREYRERAESEWGIRVPSIDVNRQGDMQFGWPAGSPERLSGLLALYAGEVAFADDSVGELVGTLEETGLMDECVLMLTSDHGQEFYEHDRTRHGHSLYPEVVHVPLIFRWPSGIPEGVRIEEPVSLVDLAPTALDLAGVDAYLNGEPAEFTGSSLVPLLNGEPYIPMPIFFERLLYFDQDLQGVLFDNLLYIGGSNSIFHSRLYNLLDDPGAFSNIIADRPEDAERLALYLAEYDELCASIAQRIGATRSGFDQEQLRALGYVN